MKRGAWLIAAVAAGACQGERASHDRIARTGDAAPVVMVDRPGGGTGGDPTSDLPLEREPNARPADALALGAGAQGVLDGEADVDAFVIDSPGPRMLTAALAPMAGVDARLELRDKAFAVIATSDRGGVGIGEGLADAPLDKGRFYLVVREIAKPPKAVKPKPGAASAAAPTGRIGRSPPYTLTATLIADPAAGAEREPDDDAGAANDVSLIEPATGHIGWSGDVDVWKLSLEGLADGNGLDVTVTGIPGVSLGLAVSDAADRPRVAATGLPGQPLSLRSVAPRLDPGQAPVHYVKVSGKPSDPGTSYTLSVSARLLDLDEEAEPNDKPALATPLRYGGDDQGSMRALIGPGETDVFLLSSSSGPRQLDATVDGVAGVDLVCEVLLGAAGTSTGKGDRGGPGAGEDCTGLVPAGGESYVRITVKPSKKPIAPVEYTLRWSSAPGGLPAAAADDPLPPEE